MVGMESIMADTWNGLLKFEITSLLDNSVTDFDLFLSVDEQLVSYASPGYLWERSEISRLLDSGYTSFLIRQEDSPKVALYLKLNQINISDQSFSSVDRISHIEEIGQLFTRCLYESDLTDSLIHKANVISGDLVDTIIEDKSCIRSLKHLADCDLYTYYHSVRVASYATAIALELGLTDRQELQKVAIGCLMHDVGKKFIGADLLNKRGALSQHEWHTMRQHPKVGYQYLSESSLATESLEIVVHHHEKLNGGGYPHGLTKDELLMEVQVACTADIFDALTSSRSYQLKRSRFEALDLMKQNMLNKEISAEPYKALISCLR